MGHKSLDSLDLSLLLSKDLEQLFPAEVVGVVHSLRMP